jgi:hypothetical protein
LPKVTTRVGTLPPPVPPKDTVIPIHTSDRATFKQCRRKWDWSSPMRSNLRPNPRINGIALPLWFGTGIHLCLERMYDPTLSRDPVETFRTWYNLQTIGGMVSRQEYDDGFANGLHILSYHLDNGVPNEFHVEGLFEVLPDPDPEEFEAHLELGVGMMEFYRDYAAKNDNFAVIATEHDFSVPLWADDDHDHFLMGDGKPVHYRGRMDLIIQDLETGRYGIMDHKTAAKADGEEYAKKLEKDEQVTSYMWAAEQEARIHDLEYKEIDFVLYNTLWKGFPRPPMITAQTKQFPDGRPSIDRNQMTTAALWYQAVKDRNLDWWVENDKKAQSYAQYLLESGDSMFIRRDMVRRNRAEIQSAGTRILDEVHDMLSSDLRIYPNPTAHWSCLRCPFRSPCIARDDGSDWQAMIDDGYVGNYDR